MANWNIPYGYVIEQTSINRQTEVVIQKNYPIHRKTVFYTSSGVKETDYTVAIWRLKSLKTDQHVYTPNTSKV